MFILSFSGPFPAVVLSVLFLFRLRVFSPIQVQFHYSLFHFVFLASYHLLPSTMKRGYLFCCFVRSSFICSHRLLVGVLVCFRSYSGIFYARSSVENLKPLEEHETEEPLPFSSCLRIHCVVTCSEKRNCGRGCNTGRSPL